MGGASFTAMWAECKSVQSSYFSEFVKLKDVSKHVEDVISIRRIFISNPISGCWSTQMEKMIIWFTFIAYTIKTYHLE
jgi:hypothetical protein